MKSGGAQRGAAGWPDSLGARENNITKEKWAHWSMRDAENKIKQVTVWPEKNKKLFSHSSVYKSKNLANKQDELELLPGEHKFDLPGFIKESGGKSHLTGVAKLTVISCLRRTGFAVSSLPIALQLLRSWDVPLHHGKFMGTRTPKPQVGY